MQDAESELRRRRDRGKVAQAAFRKRQSESLRKLKEENERLKSLVMEIVDSAGVDMPIHLKAAIIKAGRATGVDISTLEANNVDPFRENPKESSMSMPPIVKETCTETLATQLSSVERNIVVQYDAKMSQFFSHTQVEPFAPHKYSQSGRMSPRFDYGLWLDPNPFLKISRPPSDIMPYIGARVRTIAGQIVKTCMEYGQAILRDVIKKPTNNGILPGQVSDSYPPSLPHTSAARAFFDQGLRHSEQLHDIVYMAALIEERMQFFTVGYRQGYNESVSEESCQIIQERVLPEWVLRSGPRTDQWWSPLEVEKHVKAKMGVCEFEQFQAALGCEEEAHMENLRPLTQDLAKNSVCSGNGPVWKANYVMVVVNAWIEKVGRIYIDSYVA